MATDEDDLRRIVREEIGAVLPGFLREVLADLLVARVVNGRGGRLIRRNPDPELSAKRAAAAKAMWAKVKSGLSTEIPTPKPKAKRASKSKKQEVSAESNDSVQVASNLPAQVQAPVDAAPPGSRVFLAYAAAYRLRYGEFPVRNARTNSLVRQLVDRLGAAEAEPVAAHYLTVVDPLYVRSGHCLTLLLRDAEKLRTLWKQGAQGAETPTPPRPWWETWTGIEAQGRELGVDPEENPQLYRAAVLRAAYTAGRLPESVAEKAGVLPGG